jgi:hypothetical protein
MAEGGNQPRTRRRHLLALGADPDTVHMATRSRKRYWRMSQNEPKRSGDRALGGRPREG